MRCSVCKCEITEDIPGAVRTSTEDGIDNAKTHGIRIQPDSVIGWARNANGVISCMCWGCRKRSAAGKHGQTPGKNLYVRLRDMGWGRKRLRS